MDVRYIGKEIIPGYTNGILFPKAPVCPDYFLYAQQVFMIKHVLSEWRDYQRKGDKVHNMRESHLQRAHLKGSWGTEKFYFRVETECGHTFEIYYDRTPSSSQNKLGHWVLLKEIILK